jgi:enoyl-CoA hydratase/carnithine racemase
VTLRRPEKRNALNRELAEAACAALKAGAADPDVAVIVLAGEGGTLSAGADLGGGEDLTAMRRDFRNDPRAELPRLLRSLEVPTVAVVDGYALGAGSALAGCASFVVATGESVFGLPEAKLGFFPFGVVQFLVDRVSPTTVLEWALSARRVSAEEAARAGLVTHLVDRADLESTVDALTGALSSISPGMARDGKRWLAKQLAGGDPDELIAWCEAEISDAAASDDP